MIDLILSSRLERVNCKIVLIFNVLLYVQWVEQGISTRVTGRAFISVLHSRWGERLMETLRYMYL
jgi:hypothetical protein